MIGDGHPNVLNFAVGERIAHARLSQDKSVATLAKETDLAPSAIWSIERGRNAPNTRTLGAIAKALGTKSSDLLNVDTADDCGAIYEILRTHPELVKKLRIDLSRKEV